MLHIHTAYSRNNIGQKCEGNCGLWVLNEMIKKIYPENLKKIVGAIWKLPAKQHSQSSPFPLKLGWNGSAIQQATSKRHPQFFFKYSGYGFLIISFKNPQTTIALIFLTHIISDIDGVSPHVIYASSVIKAKQNKIIQN